MAATVSQEINDNGVQVTTITLDGDSDQADVDVSRLENASIQIVRTGSTDNIVVTGSLDGTNYVAVTSTTQAAGADTALTAVTAGVHTIRQKVRFLQFATSGATDSFVITVSGLMRR